MALTQPEAPGTLLRTAPLTASDGSPVQIRGAKALRILYVTRSSTGQSRISGGMAFVPDSPVPAAGRPVVAWAHPTGSPVNVAPSRSADPLGGMEPWLSSMLKHGWIVVATDYSGLGTLGTQQYLNGGAEAADVVDSVIAARQISGAHAGVRWVAWGASYGGHAVLWTASRASSLAPELSLEGVAAAAPVAELVQLEHAEGQAWAAEAAQQDPPPVTSVPILVVQGTKDDIVPTSTTEMLRSSWCAAGADLAVELVPGATHESVVALTSQTVVGWIADRFAGTPSTNTC
jgi:alpha-beta hydrolase superfamily lysophospholipase